MVDLKSIFNVNDETQDEKIKDHEKMAEELGQEEEAEGTFSKTSVFDRIKIFKKSKKADFANEDDFDMGNQNEMEAEMDMGNDDGGCDDAGGGDM